MLMVIGAGLPRTGTTSLKAALERLGFGPCYHMFDLLQHPEHVERWRPVMKGESAEWDRVFDGYRAAVDFPAALYWRQLADAYPEAKVILTVRDPHRWHASMQNLFRFRRGFETGEIPAPMRAIAELQPYMDPEIKKVLGERWGLGEAIDEDYAVEAFTHHTAKVRDALPADRLLVFEVSQGWEPLCAFLGVDAPADEPFPHLNDTDTMQRMFKDMVETNTMTTPFDARD
jgi:hypothetical protein